MANIAFGINEQNAGLFSAAAYTPIGEAVDIDKYKLTGWREVTFQVAPDDTYVSGNHKDEFRVFVNDTSQQVVIAFKGSDNANNFESDLANSGFTDYRDLRQAAADALGNIRGEPDFARYTILTTGHSLGGGMAQSFALENHLDGFGQNSLPIASQTLDQYVQLGATAALVSYQKLKGSASTFF